MQFRSKKWNSLPLVLNYTINTRKFVRRFRRSLGLDTNNKPIANWKMIGKIYIWKTNTFNIDCIPVFWISAMETTKRICFRAVEHLSRRQCSCRIRILLRHEKIQTIIQSMNFMSLNSMNRMLYSTAVPSYRKIVWYLSMAIIIKL
jgi:hypothetical protein